MLVRCVCVVVIFIGLVLTALAQNKSKERCGIPTSENQYPWLVGIEFKTKHDLLKRLQCSGALVSRRHVICNARCFDRFYLGETKQVNFGSNITVIAGSCVGGSSDHRCRDDGAIRVPIDMVIIHPEYDNSKIWIMDAKSFYDIAMIRLLELVPYTNFIRPICLPSADITQSTEINPEVYFIAGLSPRFPHAKLQAPVTYLNKTECQANIFAEDEFCATDLEEERPCLVKGGLVMNKRDENFELVGLLTYVSVCNTPRVFMNIFLHLDWIRGNATGWTPLANGCGRRKIDNIELVVHGEGTKAGDWPWHVAMNILRQSRIDYLSGGTLISKTMVLTAAHCVTIKGEPMNPEILIVTLGKFQLIGRDLQSQEKEVHSVMVHEDFAPLKQFDNDIALVKLKTEVTYSDYVQPVCIWSSEAYERLPSNRDFGTVVGWGIDQSEQLSSHLKKAQMPKVSDITCINKNPLFYVKALKNNRKFCAGWANGTSPCNGDSGGGFLIFVPDIAKAESDDAVGSWYIRGIVSLTAYDRNRGQCDPYQYVVFTDVDKYTDWIQTRLVH